MPEQLTPQASPEISPHASQVYFEYGLNGILETDSQGRVLRANPAAASITGQDIKRLKGILLSDLLTEDSKPAARRYFSLLKEQGINQTEFRMMLRNGKQITIDLASIQADDELFIHVFDDVTRERQAVAAMVQARQTAEAASRAKNNFLANISHEMRTPLNGILGLSQLALMTDLNPQQREYLKKISASGHTLLQIINDLLDYAKLEAGRMEFENTNFSLDDLLDELATTCSQLAETKPLELVFHVPAGLQRHLVGDRLRLGQCLSNLLSNAIKFTPQGTVALEISLGERLGGQTWLNFSVIDTGIGIAEEVQARLFKPFTQADSSITRRFGGTGLGLAIVRDLVRGMGGELSMESQPDRGSRFTVKLPFYLSSEPQPVIVPRGRACVLLQQPASRAAAIELLRSLGWTPEPCATDTADLASLEKNVARADLVLLDLLDAPAPLEALRQSLAEQDQRKPVLVMLQPEMTPKTRQIWGDRPHTALLCPPLSGKVFSQAMRKLQLYAGAQADDTTLANIPTEFHGSHVLVAEDNPVNQIVLIELLELAGIKTTLAQNGQEVLDQLQNCESPPDMIMMDVQMPLMDGYAATRYLRQAGRRLPIVGVTASTSKAEQAACLEAGMTDFLPKPVDMDELWGCLTRWISPSNRIEEGSNTTITPEERFLHNHQALQRAKQAFASAYGEEVKQLRMLRRSGDQTTLLRRLHTLRGSAATVGADLVASLARQLEQNLPAGVSSEQVESLFAGLDKALTAFLAQQTAV